VNTGDVVRVGRSGLQISPVVLGCMSFGDPKRGGHPWTLNEEESRPLLQAAFEAGITTLDTANGYSGGSSEEIVGRFIADVGERERFVIATKVFAPMRPGSNGGGLSRRAILEQVEGSLRRLGTDWIDLYQIHRFDPDTPVEETMEALHDVVKAGKVRYLGASSMWAWQFAQMQHIARLHHWTPFITMQDQYNLVQREEEREMHPFCVATGVGVLPWSPLARGRLTRDWDDASTARAGTDDFGSTLYRQAQDSDRAIAAAVAATAEQRGVSRAQVALAWVRQQPVVAAPIVGVTKAHHLHDAIASLQITLSDDEQALLTKAYAPRLPEGFQ
jgi:aryl-alcohol dehydrogenase-like predicted oxidoreductase